MPAGNDRGDSPPSLRLHLDEARIALETADVIQELGSLNELAHGLRHEPATATELEAAIAAIEDLLAPAVRRLPAHPRLVTASPLVRRIAALAGPYDSRPAALPAEAVETVFRRLADVAGGLPPRSAGIPADRAFAAALLFLRELLHHGGFRSIMLNGD